MRIAAVGLLLALAGVFAAEDAQAHGRTRFHLGFHFGAPYWGYWGPWWHYPPPAYHYYPAPVVVSSPPVTYIEQGSNAPAATSEGGGWWYYCESARGYYPYVKECPSGWQRVSPAPPGAK